MVAQPIKLSKSVVLYDTSAVPSPDNSGSSGISVIGDGPIDPFAPALEVSLASTEVFGLTPGAVVGRVLVSNTITWASIFPVRSNFTVTNGYLRVKPDVVLEPSDLTEEVGFTVYVNSERNDFVAADITILDPNAGLPIYTTATSGDDVITLGGNQTASARGGAGNDTYVVLPSFTHNASIFDLRGTNTIIFQDKVELVTGDETPGIYYLRLGNGATIEVHNAEAQLYQLGNQAPLSFGDFKAAIANAHTVTQSSDPVSGVVVDHNAMFVPATGDSGNNVIALGHSLFVSAAGGAGDDTYIITDFQTADARIFDLRGNNIIRFGPEPNIASAGMNDAFQYELLLQNGATIAIDNPEAYLFVSPQWHEPIPFHVLYDLLPVTPGSIPLESAHFGSQLDDDEGVFAATEASDILYGREGSDVLDGGEGADTLIGGPGDDTYYLDHPGDLVYELRDEGIDRIYLKPGGATEITESDDPYRQSVFTMPDHVEELFVEDYLLSSQPINEYMRNVIYDNALDNEIIGSAGSDTFHLSDGADYVDGGSGGLNVVSYEYAPAGIIVDLGAGTAEEDGYGNTDTLISIFGVTGSQHDDVIRGHEGLTLFAGNAGNDVFVGRGTADYIVFGQDVENGVHVDLAQGTTFDDGFGDIDTFTGIENAGGSKFEDTILGNSIGNRLSGSDGDDLIDGRAGNDDLTGGKGADLLTGGSGRDNFRYNSLEDIDSSFEEGKSLPTLDGVDYVDTITDFAPADDIILWFLRGDLNIQDNADAYFDAVTINTDGIPGDDAVAVRIDLDGPGSKFGFEPFIIVDNANDYDLNYLRDAVENSMDVLG